MKRTIRFITALTLITTLGTIHPALAIAFLFPIGLWMAA